MDECRCSRVERFKNPCIKQFILLTKTKKASANSTRRFVAIAVGASDLGEIIAKNTGTRRTTSTDAGLGLNFAHKDCSSCCVCIH